MDSRVITLGTWKPGLRTLKAANYQLGRRYFEVSPRLSLVVPAQRRPRD